MTFHSSRSYAVAHSIYLLSPEIYSLIKKLSEGREKLFWKLLDGTYLKLFFHL